MNTTGTWYPPSLGTGGVLITNPPFATMPLSTGDTLYRTPRHEPWPQWHITVHRAPGGNLPVIVRFVQHHRLRKGLDQCAAWLPAAGGWDLQRWAPNQQRRQVPTQVLAAVELALQGGGQ